MPSDYIADQNEEIEDKLNQIDIKLEALHENKADDLYYDEAGNYVQLVANGELIGNRVELPDGNACGIVECKINEDGHLVVILSDGRVIDAGYVGNTNGATFVPHISENKILSWTCDQDLPVPDPIDLNPFDNWSNIEDDGATDYVWETM